MSNFKFSCPHCGQSLEVPEDLLGQVIECPACNQSLQLPDPEPAASTTGTKKKIVMRKRKKTTRSPSSFNKTMASSQRRSAPQGKNKACPFCGEEILSVAVKCKHCGSDLASGARSGKSSSPAKGKTDQNSTAQGCAVLIVIGIVIFIFTTISDCGGPSGSSTPAPPAPKHDAVSAWTIQGVNYTVIEKTNLGTMKGSIVIRIEKKVTRDLLHKLALNLKEAQPRTYDRLFIEYYLPGMTPGDGAWATSHFNPTLEVRILGTTIEQEKALKAGPKESSDEIIGEWLDEAAIGMKYTLKKKNGKIIMVLKFKDGGSLEQEMLPKKHSGKLRFEKKEGNVMGEYYLIERNGSLGIYDRAGLIHTIPPMK